MTSEIFTDSFFPELSQGLKSLFKNKAPVWEALDGLKAYIRERIRPNIEGLVVPMVPMDSHAVILPDGRVPNEFELICDDRTNGKIQVWIKGKHVPEAAVICSGTIFSNHFVQVGSGVIIEPCSLVKGPCIIGDNTEVRHGAYIRGNCLIGKKCVVGHATEVKGSIFMDGAKAGHFAYVGDSILGEDVNLGAGTKLANFRFAPGNIFISLEGKRVDTQRRKFGAILGNKVQSGCNSVTNPGVLMGFSSVIAPNTTIKPGYYSPKSIIR